jgi:sarcosine oxidase
MAMKKNYDVIVLGVGSMGSSTCYHLAAQGVNVLGLEQFDIPHEIGSHGGQSRLIRKAYFEHPDYVPLLERAYLNWQKIEQLSGVSIYTKTGLLYFGKPDQQLIKGVKESAAKYGIEVNTLTDASVKNDYPQFSIPDDYEKLFEPDAGFVSPEKAILAYTRQAIQLGAVIKTKEKIVHWERHRDGVIVNSETGNYSAKKLIITAGPWAGKLIPGLARNLKITRQVLAWVKPKKNKDYELGKFPCWTIADDNHPGIFYGFPILPIENYGGPIGLKIAHHYPGSETDPDTISRIPVPADESILTYALNKFLPEGYESTLVLKTCMYTNTPDENFILDFVPGYNGDVIAATGFSGHGFKFASVVGEIMSDLAIKGSTNQPIEFLKANRFQ